MRKQWIYAIQIFSLITVCSFATSCGESSLSSPPSSVYPADMSGYVTVAEKVIDRDKAQMIDLIPREGIIYWIVEISVTNKNYEDPVVANYGDWKIVAGNEVYDSQRPFCDIVPYTDMNVPMWATGETIIMFAVPDTIKVSDAKLCYQGQEPFSYCELTGGSWVAVYNWELMRAVEETPEFGYKKYFVERKAIGYGSDYEPDYEYTYMMLRTVSSWDKSTYGEPLIVLHSTTGEQDVYWIMEVHIDQAPWVVNWSSTLTEVSPLERPGTEHDLYVWITPKADFDKYFGTEHTWLALAPWFSSVLLDYRGVSENGIACVVCHETGDYVIVLVPSALEHVVDWWIRIGVE